jgi:hypothetical protein
MRPAIIVVSFVMLAVGCGQRGDLYLRDKPPSGVKPPKPEVYTPLPYPKDAGENEGTGEAKK